MRETPGHFIPRHLLNQRLADWLDQSGASETGVLVTMALVVGLGTGLGAVGFIWLIRQFHLVFSAAGDWGIQALAWWAIALVPMVGGLIGGPFIVRFAREAKGHGVPEVMTAIALRGGRIRPRVVVVKALASAICIGSGGSAGREGPIVQIGAAFGSTVGQIFRLSDDRIRNLVACGAAAGIAATFNAPIAGAIFALEVILGEFTTRYFASVVLSSVAASIVSRSLLGSNPAFIVPAYSLVSAREVGLYAILGILAALIAILFVRVLYWFEDLFDSSTLPEMLRPAVGMLLVGVLGLAYPQVLGSGLEFIGETLVQNQGFTLLLVLSFAKILATSFTLGAGNSGGVFAPALFIGAMLGGAFGDIVHSWWPALTGPAGAYALVGMAAVFAGAARAPITAVLIVFEMSNDYRLILPLMMATVISTLLAEHLFRESIYTLKLTRRGIRLERGHDIDVMQGILVGEAMTRDIDTVDADLPLPDLERTFVETHHHGFPVLGSDGGLSGVVTLQDLERAKERGSIETLRVRDIATANLLVAYPDEPLWAALKRLGTRDIGRLPVVSRNNPRQLLGIIRRNDIVRAYNLAIARRAEMQERRQRLQLGKLTNTEFVELEIIPHSPLIGLKVRDLKLPRESLVVSIRRGRNVIIPHGDTVLQEGDHVVVLAEANYVADIKSLFRRQMADQAAEPPGSPGA